MTEEPEAEFVVVGVRGQGEPLGYLTAGGEFSDLPSAAKFSFDEANAKATEIAQQDTSKDAPLVAPLLFGIPDMEQAIAAGGTRPG